MLYFCRNEHVGAVPYRKFHGVVVAARAAERGNALHGTVAGVIAKVGRAENFFRLCAQFFKTAHFPQPHPAVAAIIRQRVEKCESDSAPQPFGKVIVYAARGGVEIEVHRYDRYAEQGALCKRRGGRFGLNAYRLYAAENCGVVRDDEVIPRLLRRCDGATC